MSISLSRTERQVLAILSVLGVIGAVLHEVMQLKTLGAALQEQLLEDYYTVLGVADTASMQEIQTAFRRATNQFQSRPKDDAARLRRAKVVAAHEMLTDQESRAKYDARRRIVQWASSALTAACVVVPSLAFIGLIMKCVKSTTILGPYGVDVRSFEGKLMSIFGRLETTVEIPMKRESPDMKLGLRLVPVQSVSGQVLQVAAIAPDSVANAHNTQKSFSRGTEPAWWSSPEIWTGDTVVSVNGTSSSEQIMQEFSSASQIKLTVKRSPAVQALLPWVAEVDLRREHAGERWGCQMSPAGDGSPTLEVLEVDAEGALARWNRQHSQVRVRPGDRIAAVNKKLGVNSMLSALQDPSCSESKWMVLRGVLKSPPAAELVGGPFRKRDGQKLGIRIGRALESPVRGAIVEPLGGKQTVVKEVVPGHLVDAWNQQQSPGASRLVEGALVLSVNGKTDPHEFAAELGKPVVQIITRMPLGGCGSQALPECALGPVTVAALPGPPAPEGTSGASGATTTGAAATASSSRQRSTPAQPSFWELITPSFLKPPKFEDQVRTRLSSLRCEYTLEVTRRPSCSKVGLQLQPASDDIGGLVVNDVAPDSLVSDYDGPSLGRNAGVKAGDRLMSVNGVFSAPMMIELLSNRGIEKLALSFSRKALDAAPGLWEAEIVRRPGEGWGMELQEPADKTRKDSTGGLCIAGITANLAIDRWNQQHAGTGVWMVELGDMVVAVEPEVKYNRMLEKLKSSNQVRIMLLRWHSGPAPEVPSATAGGKESTSPGGVYEVVLYRRGPADRLGVRLEPSTRNPARTMVAEVLPGGLMEAHNKLATRGPTGNFVSPGDEVETINGQADSSRFAQCCQAETVVIRLARRAPAPASPAPQEQPPAPSTAPAPPVVPAPPGRPAGDAASGGSPLPPVPPQSAALPPSQGEVAAPKAADATAPAQAAVTTSPAPANAPTGGVAQASALAPGAKTQPTTAPEVAAVATSPFAAFPQPPVQISSSTSCPSSSHCVSAAADQPSTPCGGQNVGPEDASTTAAPLQRAASAADAKEVFLLKAEIEQLRRRLESDSSREELKELRRERDELRQENEALQKSAAENQALQRTRSADAAEQRRVIAEASDMRSKLASLTEERNALAEERATLRAQAARQDDRLQQERREAAQRIKELEASNARLLAEAQRLGAALAERPAAPTAPPEASGSGGTDGVANAVRLRALTDEVSQLQELSLLINRVLEDEASPGA